MTTDISLKQVQLSLADGADLADFKEASWGSILA